ncbi:MAG: hypothetical protein COA69_10090 [Robiginitomaculum sp.]|nr:MAG: hypothetical protein COA69_10090 [Robiginitomaculum sp.]
MLITGTYIYQTTTLWLRIALFSVILIFASGLTVFAQTPSASSLAGDEGQSLFERAKAYHDGDGVDVDLDKARALYQRAAVQGDMDARVNLGYMYFIGEGVLQDFDVARTYYLQAANAGDTGAQKTLGVIYEHGLGVAVDMKTAQRWYDKSDGRTPAPRLASLETRPQTVVKKRIVKAPVPEILPERLEARKVVKAKDPARVADTQTHTPAKDMAPTNMVAASQAPKVQMLASHEADPIINVASLTPPPETSLNFAQSPVQALISSGPLGALGAASLNMTVPDLAVTSIMPTGLGPIGLGPSGLWEVSSWVSSGIGALLLTVAFASTIWFISQMRYLRRAEQQYDFATGFFERHRESLRGSYLRTPDSQRLCLYPQDPWSVSLCALMVRFAARRQDNTEMSCKTSAQIMHALENSPYEARMKTFAFVPLVQERLFADIQHLSNGKLQPPKPFQFKHTAFTSTSKLIKARRMKTPPIERVKTKLKRPLLQVIT